MVAMGYFQAYVTEAPNFRVGHRLCRNVGEPISNRNFFLSTSFMFLSDVRFFTQPETIAKIRSPADAAVSANV